MVVGCFAVLSSLRMPLGREWVLFLGEVGS